MYLLYPRLPLAIAEKLAYERCFQSTRELVKLSNVRHESATIAPVGGNRADEGFLHEIQKQMRDCARGAGYPNLRNEESFRKFDLDCARLIHDSLCLHPSEASHIEMWAFMSCVLVPDLVRWRFPGESTSVERFIGSDRGLRRNTFGRLWWRAYLLNKPLEAEPYILLNELVEDDLVQVTERNSMAANKLFLTTFCTLFIEALHQYKVPRRLLMRESSKRARRLLSLISFEGLDTANIRAVLEKVFADTAKSLKGYEDKSKTY